MTKRLFSYRFWLSLTLSLQLSGVNTSLQSIATALNPGSSVSSSTLSTAFTSGAELGGQIVGLMIVAWGFLAVRKVLS